MFWVPEHPEEGGSRRSARELDFEILVEKSMCLLGGRGVELEMHGGRWQIWDVKWEGMQRRAGRGQSPGESAFRGRYHLLILLLLYPQPNIPWFSALQLFRPSSCSLRLFPQSGTFHLLRGWGLGGPGMLIR